LELTARPQIRGTNSKGGEEREGKGRGKEGGTPPPPFRKFLDPPLYTVGAGRNFIGIIGAFVHV